jgi:RNA polymerase sigma factor (sigma-70 family)
MPGPGSVTCWISALEGGDAAAAQKLWERYYRRLVGLARKKLQGTRRYAADESDVVQNAFLSFFRGVDEARFPQLKDRDNLWRLLVVITARKAVDLANREACEKRGGGKVGGEPALVNLADSTTGGLEAVVGSEPTPGFIARMAEEHQRLLQLLDEDELRSIAVWKMERYTNQEIAERLDCSLAKVERRLGVIRKRWESKITS